MPSFLVRSERVRTGCGIAFSLQYDSATAGIYCRCRTTISTRPVRGEHKPSSAKCVFSYRLFRNVLGVCGFIPPNCERLVEVASTVRRKKAKPWQRHVSVGSSSKPIGGGQGRSRRPSRSNISKHARSRPQAATLTSHRCSEGVPLARARRLPSVLLLSFLSGEQIKRLPSGSPDGHPTIP